MGARSTRNTTQNNRSDGHLLEYFRKSFLRGGGGTNFVASGLTATGGAISDYTDPGPGIRYRAHVFTSTGTFSVSALGSYGNTVEYLVVAGGGGGGARHGGGGGAGGLLVSPAFPGIPTSQNQGSSVTVSAPNPYSVVVGGGGARGLGPSGNTDPATLRGSQGTPSSFGPVSATGGGYGTSFGTSPTDGGPGGSGGGGGQTNASTFGAAGPATNYPGPTQQGYPSGTSGPGVNSHATGGGGGAGEIGQNAVPGTTTAGRGGAGLTVYIAAPPTAPAPDNSYAGGGGGGGDTAGAASPIGGGGAGGPIAPGVEGTPGTINTGGGGGGTRTGSGPGHAGNGGDGIVIVRYQIA